MNSGAPCVDVPYRYTPIIGRKNPSCDVNKVTKIGLDRGPRGAYSSICCLQPQVVRHLREWRNRQTRTVQVRVPVRAWGFNSPLAHQLIPGSVEPGIFLYPSYPSFLCVCSIQRAKHQHKHPARPNSGVRPAAFSILWGVIAGRLSILRIG